MNVLPRRALALLATLTLALSSSLVSAPEAAAARGAQSAGVPTLYIDLTGTYYRTNQATPTVTTASATEALAAINGSFSHTIAGGATYEVVDPANPANNFTDTGTTQADGTITFGEVRGRGNYTWQTLPNLWRPTPEYAGWVSSISQGTASFTQAQAEKRPYQMKLSTKHDMLGMGSAKTWVLLANHSDASLMRNKVAFDLAAEFGLPFTPQSRFIDLVINGQYLGSYLLVEKVQEGSTRVSFSNPSGTGVLVEMDNNYYAQEPSNLVYTSPRGSHFVLKDAAGGVPDPDASGNVVLPPAVQAGWDDFQLKINWFESLLYAQSPDWTQISAYLDVPSFIKFYFVQEFTENPEIAKSSIYFYKDGVSPSDVFHAGPVWDFDSSLGNYSDPNFGGNPNVLYARNILTYRPAGTTASNDYFSRLFRMSGFESAAKALYVDELKLPIDEASGKLWQYQTLMAASAAKNFQKYPVLGRNKFFPPFMSYFRSTWAGEVGALGNYMNQRAAYLNSVYAPGVAANASDCKASSTPAVINTAGAFNALSPCRMLDTRTGNGGTGPVASGGVVPLKVTGRGGVPTSGVSAVVLNVTVANPTHEGFITAYPDGTAVPVASNLNFVPGQVAANQVTVKVGANGIIDLKNSVGGSTHLIADLSGYFVDGTATQPGAFSALDPARIMDTREGVGAPKAKIPANGTIDLQVTGVGGVPADAGAVAMNVTVANPATVGALTVYPAGVSPIPTVSNINFTAAKPVPNAVTIKVGNGGKVSIANLSTDTIDVVADVNGYYKAGTATAPGMFVPLSPSRILDSRIGTGMPKGDFKAGTARRLNNYETIALQVGGVGGVPKSSAVPAAGAVVMNVTVANPTQVGFLTVSTGGTVRPQTSSLNYAQWQVVPNLATVKLGSAGTVNIYNGTAGQTDVISDVSGYYIK